MKWYIVAAIVAFTVFIMNGYYRLKRSREAFSTTNPDQPKKNGDGKVEWYAKQTIDIHTIMAVILGASFLYALWCLYCWLTSKFVKSTNVQETATSTWQWQSMIVVLVIIVIIALLVFIVIWCKNRLKNDEIKKTTKREEKKEEKKDGKATDKKPTVWKQVLWWLFWLVLIVAQAVGIYLVTKGQMSWWWALTPLYLAIAIWIFRSSAILKGLMAVFVISFILGLLSLPAKYWYEIWDHKPFGSPEATNVVIRELDLPTKGILIEDKVELTLNDKTGWTREYSSINLKGHPLTWEYVGYELLIFVTYKDGRMSLLRLNPKEYVNIGICDTIQFRAPVGQEVKLKLWIKE